MVGLAVALDEGVVGFRWPRSEADDLWEMLGFPVAVGGVFVHVQGTFFLPGEEFESTEGRRRAFDFADALERHDFESAYRVWKAMDLQYPPIF